MSQLPGEGCSQHEHVMTAAVVMYAWLIVSPTVCRWDEDFNGKKILSGYNLFTILLAGIVWMFSLEPSSPTLRTALSVMVFHLIVMLVGYFALVIRLASYKNKPK